MQKEDKIMKKISKDNAQIAEFMFTGNIELYVPDYHVKWDWLMPVVERIEKMGPTGYEVSIIDCECEIGTMGYQYTTVARGIGLSKIEAVYSAVISFIKWHNLNNKKK